MEAIKKNILADVQGSRNQSSTNTIQELNDLLNDICDIFNADIKGVKGKSKQEYFVDIRHAFSIIACKKWYSMTDIAQLLNRDHSSISHLVNNRPFTEFTQQILYTYQSNERMISHLALQLSKNPKDEQLKIKLKNYL